MTTVTINGHQVAYDENFIEGMRYLVRIGTEESKVFFDEAYARGHAKFEDHLGTKFNLVHNGGQYQIVKL